MTLIDCHLSKRHYRLHPGLHPGDRGQFLVPPEMRVLVGAGVLLDGLVGAVFVFLLAIKINGPGVGILYGVLSLIPCIGLIILLVVNSQATTFSKKMVSPWAYWG